MSVAEPGIKPSAADLQACVTQSCPKADGQIVLHMSQGGEGVVLFFYFNIFFLGRQGRVIGNIHEKGMCSSYGLQ